jgi:hypothetical protein
MNQLEGTNVLVVEDDPVPAAALCSALREMGARIVGPAATVSEALVLLASEQVDAAILDVSLGGDLVYPVADILMERLIPFVLASGFPIWEMPVRYWHLPLQHKPYCESEVAQRLAAMCRVADQVPFPAFQGPDPSREQRRGLLS